GTITFKNNGPNTMTSPQISFEVPSGVACDFDGSGWKHTQNGSTCTYSRTSNLSIKPGASYTLNYSTDSEASFSASSVSVSDASCGGSSGTSGGSGAGDSTSSSSSSSSSSTSSGSGDTL